MRVALSASICRGRVESLFGEHVFRAPHFAARLAPTPTPKPSADRIAGRGGSVYRGGMEKLHAPVPGEVWLLHTPPRQAMFALVARMATIGPVLALDAADEFDAHQVARLIRRRAPRRFNRSLGHVRVGRAGTCYQVLALFKQLPATSMPHIIFDLPATFCDESVPLPESRRLLQIALNHVDRLRREAPIIISVRPTPGGRRAELLQAVIDRADHLFVWESPGVPVPVKLF